MKYELVTHERGSGIIEDWCEGQSAISYEIPEENEGGFIFYDGSRFVTIENYSWSECNVEEFATLNEAKDWLGR